jgi:uncharacterized protein involved in exopolysaccharide biosynthesis
MANIEWNLRDYLRIVRKRWGIVFLTVGVPIFTLAHISSIDQNHF